jgi:hypothetical protein
MGNEHAPHVVLLFIRAEIHEQNQSGELSGNPVKREEFPVAFPYSDRYAAEKGLGEFIAELKERCRKKEPLKVL